MQGLVLGLGRRVARTCTPCWISLLVLGTDTEKAINLSQFRRKVSLVAAKAQSACLIGRVSKVGESFREAAKRRKLIERE